MSELSPVGPGSPGSATRAALNGSPVREVPFADGGVENRPADRVELSDEARLLEHLRGLPPVREDLVNSLRGAIARGDYPADDVIDAAIDRLIDDL